MSYSFIFSNGGTNTGNLNKGALTTPYEVYRWGSTTFRNMEYTGVSAIFVASSSTVISSKLKVRISLSDNTL